MASSSIRRALALLLAAFLALACRTAPGSGAGFTPITAGGERLGLLRKLDAWPLHELRYTAPYRLEDIYEAGAAARRGGGEGPAFACTCLAATDAAGHRIMGRNFDWQRHPILVLATNPPGGLASLSVVDIHYLGYTADSSLSAESAALHDAWRIPFDGMNEAGLAVGMMAVGHAEGMAGRGDEAGRSSRRAVDELGLIRLLLDRASSVEKALAIMAETDVHFSTVPIHYFVADRAGASAVVEYLGGTARVLRNEAPWQVSTNFIFAETPRTAWTSSCRRYAVAEEALAASGGRLEGRGAFGLLGRVAQPSTIWSSSWDLTAGELSLSVGRRFGGDFRFTVGARD